MKLPSITKIKEEIEYAVDGEYCMDPVGRLDYIKEITLPVRHSNDELDFSIAKIIFDSPYRIESIQVEVPARSEKAQYSGDTELIDITPIAVKNAPKFTKLEEQGYVDGFESIISAKIVHGALKDASVQLKSLSQIKMMSRF